MQCRAGWLAGICAAVVGLTTMLGVRPAHAAAAAERVDRETQDAMARDAHPRAGGAQYARDCSTCHGSGADGDATRRIPALRGQRFAYLVRQQANFAGAERDSPAMHAALTQPALQSPQAWADIAAYLNGLAAVGRARPGPGVDLARGREVFGSHCASCHGADAAGDEDGFVPSLRHQHFAYLESQMRKLADGRRHNVDAELQVFLGNFADRDMNATADYLSRLDGPGKDRKHMRGDGVVVD